MKGVVFLALLTLFTLLIGITAENILFLLPIGSKSHKNVFQPLIKALADRSHKITVASPIPPSKPYPNVREIVPAPYDQLFEDFPDPFEMRKKNKLQSMLNMSLLFEACEKVFKSQDFINLQHEKFDLVIWNGFVNDCFAGLVYKIGAPFAMLTTIATPSMVAENVGYRLPPSFVPSPMIGSSDEMTFWQRLLNVLMDFLSSAFFKWSDSTNEEIYRKYLGADLPGLAQIKGNVSLIFSNSYFPLTYPRPLLPDIVEIGGMHCGESKPLQKDLDDFLNGAEHGFIYFSLGSIVKTDQMPDSMRRTFLNVFSRLKQRVIWKWNSGHMDNVPKNVKLSSWLPQQDILGHPKIRLFMTHGGLLSTQEAAYHGVPLLGIPVFADQDMNVAQAARSGYATMLEILDLSEELLEDRLNEVLNNPEYTLKAKKLSSVIKDQPQTPLTRAVFWTEYLIRHKGAHHLRSAARKLNFIQYHSLDVMAAVLAILITGLVISIACCKAVFRKVCTGQKGSKHVSPKKKNK